MGGEGLEIGRHEADARLFAPRRCASGDQAPDRQRHSRPNGERISSDRKD